jgi:hypothetical protein
VTPSLVLVDMFNQMWVQDESDDYKLGHLAGACVHQYVGGEDEYVQY